MKYDVFLSYRRKGGFETAKHLFDLLTNDGYKVCLDLDTLREGDFDKALLSRIDDCQDFIIIIDANAFDRSVNPDFDPKKDWLRQELAYALMKGKNVIPVLLAGAYFPDNLPTDICQVAYKHGPSYSLEYFDSFYNKLKKFLHAKRTLIRKLWLLSVIVVLALIGIILFFAFNNRTDITGVEDNSVDVRQSTIESQSEPVPLPTVVEEPEPKPVDIPASTKITTTTISTPGISNLSGTSTRCNTNVESLPTETYNQIVSGKVGGYEYVDLGLSVMWASCNVGASRPGDSGQFFAWGEFKPKSEYIWTTYTLLSSGNNKDNAKFKKYSLESNDGSEDGLNKLELRDDAANVIWNDNWRMPTKEEFDELINNCNWKWTKVDGMPGFVVSSKKRGLENNSIFLPAAGYYLRDVQKMGERGCYWSATLGTNSHSACYLGFISSLKRTYNEERYIGRSIRPVIKIRTNQ